MGQGAGVRVGTCQKERRRLDSGEEKQLYWKPLPSLISAKILEACFKGVIEQVPVSYWAAIKCGP